MARKLHRAPVVGALVTVLPAASPALLSGAEGPWHYRLGRVRPAIERAAASAAVTAAEVGPWTAMARAYVALLERRAGR